MKRRGFLSGVFALPFAGVSKGAAAVKPVTAYAGYVTGLAGEITGTLEMTSPMLFDDAFFDSLMDPDVVRIAYEGAVRNVVGPGLDLSGKSANIGGTSFLLGDGEDVKFLLPPENYYDLDNLPPGHA